MRPGVNVCAFFTDVIGKPSGIQPCAIASDTPFRTIIRQNSGGSSAPTVAPTPVLRLEAGSYVANLAAANTLFVMRLNDRAGEMRYIDPVTEQERSSRLWLRQIGGHNAWRDSNGQLRTTSHRYVSQLGAELLTGGFTDVTSSFEAQDGGRRNSRR